MDAETREIRKRIGALFDAFTCRASGASVSFAEKIHSEQYDPQSEEELKIWADLTAPAAYPALQRYFDFWKSRGTDLTTDPLHRAILTEAARRRNVRPRISVAKKIGARAKTRSVNH